MKSCIIQKHVPYHIFFIAPHEPFSQNCCNCGLSKQCQLWYIASYKESRGHLNIKLLSYYRNFHYECKTNSLTANLYIENPHPAKILYFETKPRFPTMFLSEISVPCVSLSGHFHHGLQISGPLSMVIAACRQMTLLCRASVWIVGSLIRYGYCIQIPEDDNPYCHFSIPWTRNIKYILI